LRNAGGSAAPAFHSAPKAAQPAPEASAAPTVSSSSPASGDTHNTLDENAPHEAEGSSPIVKSSPISNVVLFNLEIVMLAESLVCFCH